MRILIIGGGGAGLFAGATAKQLLPEAQVTMVSDEALFCRCSTPYVISDKAEFANTVMPDSMITQMGIELVKGKAIKGDAKEKSVTVAVEGAEEKTFFYEKLVFATGAEVFIPPIEGIKGKDVYPIRRVEDLERINTLKSKVKSVAIIGAGVIGVEIAAALKEYDNAKNLYLIDIAEKPLGAVADPIFSEEVAEILRHKGVELRLSHHLTRIEDSKGKKRLFFSEGEDLEVELVLLATGVRPLTDLAAAMGVKVEKKGIPVNAYFQTNIPEIYAVGDVALTKNLLTGKHAPCALASTAVIQGKFCGRALAGNPMPYPGHISAMGMRFFDKDFGACGLTLHQAEAFAFEAFAIDVVTTDIYEDLKGATPVKARIIFQKPSLRLLGLQILGKNIVGYVNTFSLALQQSLTAMDFLSWHYVAHPGFTPWPFKNPIVMACERAVAQMSQA